MRQNLSKEWGRKSEAGRQVGLCVGTRKRCQTKKGREDGEGAREKGGGGGCVAEMHKVCYRETHR